VTFFGVFDWPSSGSSIVYIKEKIISGQGFFFINIKYRVFIHTSPTAVYTWVGQWDTLVSSNSVYVKKKVYST